MYAIRSYYEGGDFFFNDLRINDMDVSKRNIGMVFQNYAIFPHYTVRQNVEFGLKNRKFSREEIDRATGEFLELMQISEFRDRMPERLSGGQQHRITSYNVCYTKLLRPGMF